MFVDKLIPRIAHRMNDGPRGRHELLVHVLVCSILFGQTGQGAVT